MFKIHHAKNEDGSVHLTLSGSLDTEAAERFEEELDMHLTPGTRFLLIDMEKLHYLASAGLRVLLSSAKKAKNMGVDIVICSLQPLVHSVFDATGFTRIFSIFTSREEAHKSRSQHSSA